MKPVVLPCFMSTALFCVLTMRTCIVAASISHNSVTLYIIAVHRTIILRQVYEGFFPATRTASGCWHWRLLRDSVGMHRRAKCFFFKKPSEYEKLGHDWLQVEWLKYRISRFVCFIMAILQSCFRNCRHSMKRKTRNNRWDRRVISLKLSDSTC